MLTVHHLEDSRSQRILWLLEELELPYEIVTYKRNPQTRLAPPELRKVHPLGKSPVLVDGGTVVAETGAIITYVLQRHGQGRLMPAADAPDWVCFQHWLHHAEGSAMPPLLMKLVVELIPKRAPWFIRPVAQAISQGVQTGYIDIELKRLADYWAASLEPTGWFAGADFSAADVAMSFPIEAARMRGLTESRPPLGRFLKAIAARPAYRRAIARGGPYRFDPG